LTFTYAGLVNGDTKAATEPTIATAATASSAVGTYSIALTGGSDANYDLTLVAGELAVTKAPLTITGMTGVNKVYDGTPAATGTGTAALSGIIGSDVVTLAGSPTFTFEQARVGTGIGITTTGYALSGAGSGNYSLTQPSLTADITAKTLTITGLSGVNKVYDGTKSATATGTAVLSGLIGSDVVILAGAPVYTFADANLGTSKVITTTGYTLSGVAAGNYSLTQPSLSADITAKAASTLSIDVIADQTYTGAAITPIVMVKDGNATLTLGSDYTVAYSNNKNAGTATVTITGIGNYTSTKTQTFVITAKAASALGIDAIANQTYTGAAITPIVMVKDGNATLTLGTDYTVAYSNNKNAGTATVTITGTGNYTSTKAQTFVITAKALKITADNKERNFGVQNPILTFKYEGLVDGEQRINIEPSISTSAKSDSEPGDYPIILTGGSDPNYTIVLVNGILKIVDYISTVRNLQATVDNQTIEVGWEKPQEFVSEIVGYKLEISEDSLNYQLLSKTEKLTFKIEGLTNSQKYWIRVSAYSVFSSSEEKVIGPLIPIAPAIIDVVVAGNQTFGESVVIVNGEKVEPTIQTSENLVSLKVGDIVMDLGGSSESGGKLPIVEGVLLLEPKGKVELKGGGFKRNTSLVVWLIQNSAATTGGRLGEFNPYLQSKLIEGANEYQYSSKVMGAKTGTAYFLGYSDVDANGNFTSNLVIPEDLILGRFTLQARGIGKGGEPASINLGAIVTEDLTLDTDGDEVPDYLESRGGTNPKDSASFLDTDKDGVPDHVEKNTGTDFKNPFDYQDSDGDKVPDYLEKRDRTSFTNPDDYLDLDGDDVPNYIEVRENTELDDPGNYLDSDGDLVPDYIESRDGTDLKNPQAFKDTNLDGVPDYVQVRSIKSSTLEEVVLSWGTANHLSLLPTKVEVKINSGENKFFELVWNNTETLDILKRGTYELTGTFTIPKGYFNAYNIKGRVRVTVLPKPAPIDVTINNNSFEASATNFFIPVGAFVVNDPIDKIHVVSLFGTGYDNKYFEIKDNILFWSSKEPAAGKTTFSIVVRVRDRDGNTIEKFFEIRRSRADVSSVTVYSAFSPNGDRINDTWGVPEVRFYQGVRIMVFEKDGKPLFSTENPDIRWDGTYNGKELAVGTYFWVIQIKETGEMRRGMLNLLRK
jgi:gliding motility-associated-like protein